MFSSASIEQEGEREKECMNESKSVMERKRERERENERARERENERARKSCYRSSGQDRISVSILAAVYATTHPQKAGGPLPMRHLVLSSSG